MTYPEINSRLRTDADFNSMTDEDHHLNQTLSPLASVVKMVTMFPLEFVPSWSNQEIDIFLDERQITGN